MVDVPSICAVPDCNKPATSRGWCGKHYMRWVRNGDPTAVTINLDPDWRERFWAKVNKNGPVSEHRPELGPCWLWTKTKTTRGYGIFSIKGTKKLAHRVAYVVLVGPIPEGLELDHRCRVHPCVKATEDEHGPAHLEPVTHLVNVQRGEGATKTRCAHGHEFTPENTGRKPGNGQRYCLICAEAQRRDYFPVWYAKNREEQNRRRREQRRQNKGENMTDCPDHWHCDPDKAAHGCSGPDRSQPCPTCGELSEDNIVEQTSFAYEEGLIP